MICRREFFRSGACASRLVKLFATSLELVISAGHPFRISVRSDSRHDRKNQAGRKTPARINALSSGAEVAGLRPIDAGDKLLRIAVDHREPGGLHLNHEAMTLEEYVIVIA